MDAKRDFQALRMEYTTAGLRRDDVASNPFVQFRQWLDEAIAAEIREPNGMTLATATAEGRPSARTVLLKSFDERGFVFYTNYESRKAQEIASNPHAALVFWWGELERQVRIEGEIARVSAEQSDAYYRSRPFGSRLGAWVSPQSEVIDGRGVLEARLASLQQRYDGATDIARPENWGGYRVAPSTIEFWQGRQNRLHDRLRYSRTAVGWQIERLAP